MPHRNTPWHLAIGAMLLGSQIALAQQGCPELSFDGARLSARLTLEQVEGEVIAVMAATPGRPEQMGHMGNVCLALFQESTGTRVATAFAAEDGAFQFAHPGPGDYVLAAQLPRGPRSQIRVPLRIVAPSAPGTGRGLALRFGVEDGQPQGAHLIQDIRLRRELIDRLKVDQAVRMEMIQNDVTKPTKQLQKRMRSIDEETEAFLKQAVRRHGWPGIDVAGLQGSGAASTMLMHVGKKTQKQMLPMVEAAFMRGTVTGVTYAMLVDHVRVADGKKQLYGTMAKPFDEKREVVFLPIEDEAGVDERRARMGLPPLAQYRELMKQMYLPEAAPR
jgi:hypothetical protein